MKQNTVTLMQEAASHARKELAEHGRIRPGAFMLVRNNPQTGRPMAEPTAIGVTLEQGFGSAEQQTEFLDDLRAEAARLDAAAVVMSGEAEADLDDGGHSELRRVLVLRVEEPGLVELLHAVIEDGQLGELQNSPGAPDILSAGLLPTNQDL